jgi:cystathionine beta-lyase/cystathionine gamma-synthase
MSTDDKQNFLTDHYQSTAGRDFTSDAIHAGDHRNSSAVPIYQGNTNIREGYEGTNSYGRGLEKAGGPTSGAVEELVRHLEGGEWAMTTSCGMAAMSQVFFGLLKQGDRIIGHRCLYAGASMWLDDDLPDQWGVDTVRVDLRDLDALREALKQPTRVVYFEPYANSSMDFIDVKAVIDLAHEAGALAVVDNTFLTPYLLQPIYYGADVVLHSMTKYMAGHGDALAGVVVGRNDRIREQIHRMRILMGGVLAPMNAFLVHRGLKTLAFRMERHCASAQKVAEFLEQHPRIVEVRYLGLPSHPDHETGIKYLRGFSGMLGFCTKPEVDHEALGKALRMCKPWFSLGDVETLVLGHGVSGNPAQGIPPDYTRVSVGLEDPHDIIQDLDQALNKS